ncbi:hypothetical protein NQ317_015881 [Molorchus minor]|uniref:Uncharacterized protein n=1 Tax=Molorchus minor TaxID=1323400 RepID=A0ABQ9J0X7_9CUCU|nr:hypothetical protein NQ317_015881 [Molorchus minor]
MHFAMKLKFQITIWYQDIKPVIEDDGTESNINKKKRRLSKGIKNQYIEDFIDNSVLEHTTSEGSKVNHSDESDNKFDAFYNTSSDNSEVTQINPQDKAVGTYQYESLGQIVNSIDKGLNKTSNEIDKSMKYSQLGESENDVECTNKKHYKDKKTFCFYCEKDVSHFSRHLSTWHKYEIEVQRILSYNCKSKERRHAMSVLGKRGNFLKNRSAVQLRPVKRVESVSISSPNEFLPCTHCLGFYRKKSLYRHTKKCNSQPELVNVRRQHAQSDGHTALLMLFKHDELLKKELFPRMRADEIAAIAKKDALICNYAYSYIKGRRSKGNIDLIVRQNIRRLARLLQYAKKENNEINKLIYLLRPALFQTVVNGVNEIGKYNKDTDTYESPTVAINFGTLIKKCCDLAYIQLLQKPNTGHRKELKILKTLVESQWANEISAQAGANLNEKKWNKEELMPLTSDLKKLKDYLETVSNTIWTKKNHVAYNTLKEVVYCQIILINRRRPAEVAQLKKTNLNIVSQRPRKFFLSHVTALLSGVKEDEVKNEEVFRYFVENSGIETNEYVFHTDGKSCIDGTKILYKHALKCGVENARSISATRLWKHLATVTQLLQFSKDDLEQLSRLSDSTYQTAKLSKLLLLATEGGLEKYKGMQIDDIDIDLNPITEEWSLEDKLSCEDNEDFHKFTPPTETQNVNASNKRNVSSKQSWSNSQKKRFRKVQGDEWFRKVQGDAAR